MTDQISLLKANYCRAALITATHSSDEDARRILKSLSTERPTEDTSKNVSQAEEAALEAIRILSSKIASDVKVASFEFSRTITLTEAWIAAAS